MNLHRQSHLGGRLPAYDGRKSLYTAGALPFTSQEFHITLLDDDDGSGSERSAVHNFSSSRHSPLFYMFMVMFPELFAFF